jgi:hypothetical protein
MARLAWLAAGSVLLALIPVSAVGITETPACAGAPPQFCVSFGATVSAPGTTTPETRAGAPFDLDAAITNTSPAHSDVTGKPRWLKTLSLDLLATSTSAPQVTPSAELPDNLMIAGSASDCGSGADFTSCTAGHGTALVDVTGTSGLFDGVHPATFGIQRITNVQNTTALVEYAVAFKLCVSSSFGDCFPQAAAGTLTVTVAQPSAGTINRTLTLPVSGTASVSPASFDYSLDALAVHLGGRSGQLGNGTAADHVYDVLRLPLSCGPASDSGAATDRQLPADSVSVPQSVVIIGCPTASAVSGVVSERRVAALTATASSPIGRTIASYQWTFGDGTTTSTTTATVRHTYPDTTPRTVSVVAVDSAGVPSKTSTTALDSSALTSRAPKSVAKGAKAKLKGVLTAAGSGLGGRLVTVQRCKPSGHKCVQVAAVTTKGSGKYVVKVQVTKKVLLVVTYAGGPGLFGSTTSHLVKVH